MSLTTRPTEIAQLWEMTLPHLPAPELRICLLWARFSDETIQAAFLKMGRRFAPGTAAAKESADNIHRYASGLLINMSKEEAYA